MSRLQGREDADSTVGRFKHDLLQLHMAGLGDEFIEKLDREWAGRQGAGRVKGKKQGRALGS